MTNSFFNFTEAPDFASAIAGTYGSVNESYDRREQLERENDKTRERNAQMPLEVIKALIEFSPKAKQIADGLADRKYNLDNTKENPFLDSEKKDQYDAAIKSTTRINKINQQVKGEAFKNGDLITLEMLELDGVEQSRERNVVFENSRLTWANAWATYKNAKFKSGFKNMAHANEEFAKWRANIEANLHGMGFNNRFIKYRGDETFKDIQRNFLQTEQQAILTKKLTDENNLQINQIANIGKSENPYQAFVDWADTNQGTHNNNMGDTMRWGLSQMVTLVKSGQMNPSVPEGILFSALKAKGDKERLVFEKLGGSEKGKIEIDSMLRALESAEKAYYENIQNKYTVYSKKFAAGIQQIENDQGRRMTKLELAQHIQANWSIKEGGSNIPEFVKNRLAKETGDDRVIKAELDYKLNEGIPITEEEVLKLSDPFLEAQYLPKVKTGNPLAPSKDFQSLALSQIKGYATTHAKQEGVAVGRESTQWNNIVENAQREYPQLFAKHMKTTDSAVDAHILALKEIQQKTNAKGYDYLVANVDANVERNINLIKAEDHIKKINPNILNEGLIFGTEEVIKEAAELPTGQTHLFYDQLASSIPGVIGSEIQYKQLEIYNKMNGKDKPIKSEILLAYEKLDPQIQFYLSHHPTPAKVARAKVDAFKDDAEITYDEFDLLLPEAQAEIEKQIKEDPDAFRREISTEEFMSLTPEMQEGILGTTPQLGKLEPRKGDWQRTDRGTFIVFDGSQWVERGVFATGKKQPFQGEIDEYLDRDKVRRKI